MMRATPRDDDGSKQCDWEFQTVSNKRTGSNRKPQRLYIGNLPRTFSKQDLVQLLLQQTTTSSAADDDAKDRTASLPPMVASFQEQQIELVQAKQCKRAFVSGLDSDTCQALILLLDQLELQPGRRICVQWEQKKSGKQFPKKINSSKSNGKVGSKSFGSMSKSWAKPTTNKEDHDARYNEEEKEDTQRLVEPPTSIQEVSERVESIVREEEWNTSPSNNKKKEDHDDVIPSLLATAAAVSLVAAGGFNLEREQEPSGNDPNRISEDNDTNSNLPEFNPIQQTKQSLSSLLEDYGEFDPNWKEQNVESPVSQVQQHGPDNKTSTNQTAAPSLRQLPLQQQQLQQQEEPEESSPRDGGVNRLRRHGKAPLHIDFLSFGYHHGAPPNLRSWSHAQPLPVFDTRPFPTIPPHLSRQDGLSGLVRRILLEQVVVVVVGENDKEREDNKTNKSDNNKDGSQTLRDFTQQIADQVSNALIEADHDGGYGYAQPLHMTIYVASEYGRHRSVVAAEAAATALRKRLRFNANDRFRQPVSVGTRHRDVERKESNAYTTRRKHADKDDDGVW